MDGPYGKCGHCMGSFKKINCWAWLKKTMLVFCTHYKLFFRVSLVDKIFIK